MTYIVKLTNELLVEAKNKDQAAKITAKYLSELLKGNSPENSRGKPANYAKFYCMPEGPSLGIQGQGQNNAEVPNYVLKKINNQLSS